MEIGPFKLIILIFLIYLGYRLFISGRRKQGRSSGNRSASNKSGTVSDVLVEDPVCHCLVPKGQAVHLQHQGNMVYFCSEDCCRKFIEKGKDG